MFFVVVTLLLQGSNPDDTEVQKMLKEKDEVQKPLEPHEFTLATRDRLHRGLMYYGFGR